MRDKEQLTLREAADALGISEVSARRWVKSGKLRASQPGRKYLIHESAVNELLGTEVPKDQGRIDLAEILRTGEIPDDLTLAQLEELRRGLAEEIARPVSERRGQPIALYFLAGLEISMRGGKKVDELGDLRRVNELLEAGAAG